MSRPLYHHHYVYINLIIPYVLCMPSKYYTGFQLCGAYIKVFKKQWGLFHVVVMFGIVQRYIGNI